jgi:hypothetical protein
VDQQDGLNISDEPLFMDKLNHQANAQMKLHRKRTEAYTEIGDKM